MGASNISSSSTFNLLKSLTNGRPELAYEALLDLTGVCRACNSEQEVEPTQRSRDIGIELCVAGRVEDACSLEETYHALRRSGIDESVLVVILLCARNCKKPAPPAHRNVFGGNRALEYLQDVKSWSKQPQRPELPNMFSEPNGYEDLDTAPISFNTAVLIPEDDLESLKECIGNAARFALSHETVRLDSKIDMSRDFEPQKSVLARGATGLDTVVSKCQSLFLRRKRAARGHHSSFTSSQQKFSKKTAALPNAESIFLDELFSTCLTGSSDIDVGVEEYHMNSLLVSKIMHEHQSLPSESHTALSNRAAAVASRRDVERLLSTYNATTDEFSRLKKRAHFCGVVYQDILLFGEAYTFTGVGRVLGAMANYSYDLSRAYFCALFAVLEEQEDVTIPGKLMSLISTAEVNIADMSLIARIQSDVERTDGSCSAVVNVVLEYAENHCGNETIRHVLSRIMVPYMEYVWDWVLDASSTRDVWGNFFGTRLGTSVTGSESLREWELVSEVSKEDVRTSAFYPGIFSFEQALFILRAGRNRALLKQIAPWHGKVATEPPRILSNSTSFGSLCAALTQFADDVVARYSAVNEQHTQLTKRNASGAMGSLESAPVMGVNSSSPSSPASESRESGNAFRFPDKVDDPPEATSKASKFFVFGSKDSGLDSGQSFADVVPDFVQSEWPSPKLLYGDLMLHSLKRIDQLVREDVMRYFVEVLDVFGHLENLRAHVLLGAGDFASVLVEQVNSASRITEENEKYIQRRVTAAMTFYGTAGAGGKSFRDRTHLGRCLKSALNLCHSRSKPLTDCISLEALCIEESSRKALWDCSMSVKYSVEAPLDLILSDRTLRMYSKFFDFFLRVLRAQKCLRNLFMVSRRNSVLLRSLEKFQPNALSDRRLRVCLWQFCWQAQHFVSIFGGFSFDQVLGSPWNDFQGSWKTINSIWDLADAHRQYLEDSIRRSLLGEKHKSILGLISGGFDIVVNLDKEITGKCSVDSYCTDAELNDFVELLVSASASLRRRSAFLIDILERLMENGSHPHLETLLPQLNFNAYYQGSGP